MRLCVSQNSKVYFVALVWAHRATERIIYRPACLVFCRVQFESFSRPGIHNMFQNLEKEEFSRQYPNLGKFNLQFTPGASLKCLVGWPKIKGGTSDFHFLL